MFTGIVESVGTICAARAAGGGRRIEIEVAALVAECAIGASVCISGVCLTIVARVPGRLCFDVVTETLEKSTLGEMGLGDKVNIERALPADGRFDGHFVQGHVDGTGTVERVSRSEHESVVWIKPQPTLLPCIIPKGSVAVDGISLTIAEVRDGAFSIALIPTTLAVTTAASFSTGHRVNIETDMIARTVVHRLSTISSSGGLTLDKLHEAGFA
ncbi:MAG: riboflavin synthase [Planctomycetes bacterium]|nr:riboflavin synthase [Planctomycetota bacterium]MCH9001377.1 riboflavin synthase [Planctomycetota bacterium]